MDPDIVDASINELAQEACDAVDEGLASEEQDLGMGNGLMQQVLSTSETDFQPDRRFFSACTGRRPGRRAKVRGEWNPVGILGRIDSDDPEIIETVIKMPLLPVTERATPAAAMEFSRRSAGRRG